MASVTLTTPDISMWSDVDGTRLEIDNLILADIDEQHDAALVWFDGGDYGQLPVEYRGTGRTAGLQCSARFPGKAAGHTSCTALIALFRTARESADARLMLRTIAGLVDGFDEAYVGRVSSWQRPRVLGQFYDVTFRLDLVDATVEV